MGKDTDAGGLRLRSERRAMWAVLALTLLCSGSLPQEEPTSQPNVLLIVADDLNFDSVGVYGAGIADITPNIDRLASEGLRFAKAHVNVSVCQPSRQVLMTGRYSHNSGGEGFHELRFPDVPILPKVLREAGYLVGVMGKVQHSTPYEDFEWDFKRERFDLGMGRNPGLYAKLAHQFFQEAKAAEQPFFLMANSHDPHRPFVGQDEDRGWYEEGEPQAAAPSRTYTVEECAVPGFLPVLEPVQEDVAAYYSSVRRFDDTAGAILEALDEAGLRDQTLVLFLSDNGMSFPFAKGECYLQSTQTPWIVRWPGVVKAGSVNLEDMISGVDMMPTLLEALGIPGPGGMDGRSIVPLLRGESDQGRDAVFTQYGRTSSEHYYPMRCVQTARFGYIFNAWSNGSRTLWRSENKINYSFLAFEKAANKSPEIAERMSLLKLRELEEFYDFEQDPNALNNLINSPEHVDQIRELRQRMESWMVEHKDPLLGVYRVRDSVEERERLLQLRIDEFGG